MTGRLKGRPVLFNEEIVGWERFVAMMMRFALLSLLFLLLSGKIIYGQAASSQKEQLALHLSSAQRYLAEKQPAKAIPELDAAIKLDPSNVEVRANLGVLLFFQGRFADAVPQLHLAVEQQPGLVKIRALLGIAERRTGEEGSGRSDLEAVFPQVDELKLKKDVGQNLIESYAGTGELNRGSEIVATLLKLAPTDPGLLYMSYRLHTDMATEAMLALGLSAPNSAQTHQAMAHELQRDRDLAGTIANLRKALALDPALPGIHFELAEALHASDDQRLRAESEEQYRLAVETAPADPRAATRMGDIQAEKGRSEQATEHYRRALKLQPENEDAGIGLAKVLSDKGDLAGAQLLLERVEASDPANALAHYRLSDVFRKLAQPEDVKRELELYRRYKEEREKLLLVYKEMRLGAPDEHREK